MEKKVFPAIFIATAIVSWFGIIALGHLAFSKPLIFVNQLEFAGRDYMDFFRASANIVNGGSPYDAPDKQYVTTPIPAIFNTIFVPLGFDFARLILLILIPLSMGFGFAKLVQTYTFSDAEKVYVLLAGLTGMMFGYPFYFLLERGNIDGWVFLFLGLGVYLLQQPKKEWLSGLFLSLAMVFKVYPILVMIPIIIYRKWRLLFFTCLWGVIWFGISFPYWQGLQETLLDRAQGYFRFDENGSLTSTVALFFVALPFLTGNRVKSDQNV